ncbi:MAG: hypothetical protein KC464_03065 [Myxococcales bacterium]|nr:hypothetical protein [Myxococcales bacterium]
MSDPARPHEPSFLRFHQLMPFMVRDILLVSSAYDAFLLEEDGRLDERLFSAYRGLSLSATPRITHASTARRCLEVLAERRIDLVITVVRVEDANAAELASQVKGVHPELPIVLLAFDEADLRALPSPLPHDIDRVLLWTGDAQILVAAIKQIEDGRNVEHDAREAGVQVILVVEDSLRRYSTFLSLLYEELMTQSQSLIAEGLNDLHRVARMRARPKILHATTFEEVVAFYRRYRDHVLALITDVRFPRDGVLDPDAGFALVELMRKDLVNLPVLMQSADQAVGARARGLGLWFADKASPTLLAEIRGFLRDALGFGDFVFRLPNRAVVGRACDLYELERELRRVPGESVEYHARRNHFSMWLNARTMFALASRVRARNIGEFVDIEAVRNYLLDALREVLSHEQDGVLADFSPRSAGRRMQRLSTGSIGGKGRGIAFASAYLVQHAHGAGPDHELIAGLHVSIPRTLAIGTDAYERFLVHNGIWPAQLQHVPDEEITRRCLAGDLDPGLEHALEEALRTLRGPLAVRSSSLLEDSRFQPFAGVYATFMLPNNHPDLVTRTRELVQAIKAVYASTMASGARATLAAADRSVEEEEMGVVVQEVVGTRHGDRFYPLVSGVAQSRNDYPIGHQRGEDGVALIALGLGHTVVSGRTAFRFCPAAPAVLPQFATPLAMLRQTQSEFYALDLGRHEVDFCAGAISSLVRCSLEDAERDGTLARVASVYSAADDAIRDSLSTPGPRVVTFNNLLKWSTPPLAPAIAHLLATFRVGMGCEVEIEFALELEPEPRLYLLQVRPMAEMALGAEEVVLDDVPAERVLCRTGRALGHGHIDDVRDIVYVTHGELDGRRSRAAAAEVGELDARLRAEEAPYLLIGPGRWGSSDPTLGIPIEWPQIAGARAIVETCPAGRPVEPSQGTHFFHNVTAQRIAYLTIATDGQGRDDELLDVAWLDRQIACAESPEVRHVRFAAPLHIVCDGRRRRAVVLKPGASPTPDVDDDARAVDVDVEG